MKRQIRIVVGSLLCLHVGAPLAFGLHRLGPKLYEPSEAYETPHIKWLKPAAKPVRVMFITNRWNMRAAVELSQRLDMQYETFVADRSNVFAAADRVEEESARLQAKMAKTYDAIVLQGVPWKDFPAERKYEILKHVKDGGGLVLRDIAAEFRDVYLDMAAEVETEIEPRDVAAAFPFRGLSGYGAACLADFVHAAVKASTFGRGRILELRMPPFTKPRMARWQQPPLNLDYEIAFLIKAIRYAAGRTPLVRVECPPAPVEVARRTFRRVAFMITSPESARVTLDFVLRSRRNDVYARQSRPVTAGPGRQEVAFELARVPAGHYFADLCVRQDGKVLDFGSAYVEVTAAHRIAEVSVDRQSFGKDEPITGRVTVANPGALRVRITQIDNFERVLQRVTVPLDQGQNEAAFRLGATPSALTVMQHVRAELLAENGEALDVAHATFSLSDLYPPDDVRFIAWTGSDHPARMRALYEAGFDTQYTGFTPATAHANLYHIPYCTRGIFVDLRAGGGYATFGKKRGLAPRGPDDHVRVPCLTAPDTQHRLEAALHKEARKLKHFSTREFSMGDELHFSYGKHELCFSPTCVVRFRAFLRAEYGAIDQLNREAGTDFTSFDQVEPVTLKEAARVRNLVPLWVDFRRHMEDVWMGAFGSAGDLVRQVVPGAKCGYEGQFRYQIDSRHGLDLYRLMNRTEVVCPYGGSAFMCRALADFARPGTLLGLGWIGGYPGNYNRTFQRYIVWRQLLRGANALWVYKAHHGMGHYSVQAPDYSMYDYFEASCTAVREAKQGLGRLLMCSRRTPDGIAVLYSSSSVIAAAVEPAPKLCKNYSELLDAWADLLEQSGHGFRVVSYEELARGEVTRGEFQIIILPFAQALSTAETQAIRAFVDAGGTVMADLRPGVADQHGKPLEEGALDDLFGVRQNCRELKVEAGRVQFARPAAADKLPPTVADGSLELTSGEARAHVAGTPAVIVSRPGQGRGVLLNFLLTRHVTETWGNIGYGMRLYAPGVGALLTRLLAEAGVQRRAEVAPPVPLLIQYGFRNGGQEYLGFLPELPEDSENYEIGKSQPLKTYPATVRLRSKRHVYDMRSGRYHGLTDRFPAEFVPSHARVYAVLPYRVDGIRIAPMEGVPQGGTLSVQAHVLVSDTKPGLHVLHRSVIGPDGAERSYYAANLEAANGSAGCRLRLALDEAPGRWTLRLRDVASGRVAETRFIVKELR